MALSASENLQIFYPLSYHRNAECQYGLIFTHHVRRGGMFSVDLGITIWVMTIKSIAVGIIAINQVTLRCTQYVPEGWFDIGFQWTLNWTDGLMVPPIHRSKKMAGRSSPYL